MASSEYSALVSEKDKLEKLLHDIPETDIIYRMSLQSRLDLVKKDLISVETSHKKSVKVYLLIKGKPVIDGFGLNASFGAKILTNYTNALQTIISLPDELHHVNNIILANIASNSNGFILEEIRIRESKEYTIYLCM